MRRWQSHRERAGDVACRRAAIVPAPGRAEINVVASIKPVHSLVAGVMQGIGEPVLLAGGGKLAARLQPAAVRCPGTRPGARRVLGRESLETYLAKPLQALSAAALVVPLSEAEGVRLLAGARAACGRSTSREAAPNAGRRTGERSCASRG